MSQAAMFSESAPTFGDDLDFYETPTWAVEAVIPFIPKRWKGQWTIIEPAAGRGALLGPLLSGLNPKSVQAIELHAGRFAELEAEYGSGGRQWADCTQGDFLAMPFEPSSSRECRLVAMNPPYTKPRKTIGLEFVEKALQIAAPFGAVAALLPLDFATGVERCERIHDKWKCSVYPLRRRPHFGGPHSGGPHSGARPVAWFVWDLMGENGAWEVIG